MFKGPGKEYGGDPSTEWSGSLLDEARRPGDVENDSGSSLYHFNLAVAVNVALVAKEAVCRYAGFVNEELAVYVSSDTVWVVGEGSTFLPTCLQFVRVITLVLHD